MTATFILVGLIAAAAEILGGMLIARRGRWPARIQLLLLALGAGFILGLVFLKLLPTSVEAAGAEAFALVLAGYAMLHFVEHTVVGHFHFGEETHAHAMTTPVAGLSAFGGLAVHAFFDGLSIAVGFTHSVVVGWLIAFAVVLHKFPEGLTLGSIMTSAGFAPGAIVRASWGLGLATVAGVLSVLLLPDIDAVWFGRILAFSAGTLLYVGASDLIPEINNAESRMPPLIVFAGILLYYVSDLMLEGLVR